MKNNHGGKLLSLASHPRWAATPALKPAMAENVRIELDISPKKLAEIEELMRDCGLTTTTELVNDALTLLKWAVGVAKNGRKVPSGDEKTGLYRDLETPVLSHAAGLGADKSGAVGN